MKKYDVIIAGASFAGLSVASRIDKGKVLLIDKNEIGAQQTSACCTSVSILKEIGCEDSILRIFDAAALHIKNRKIDISLLEKYCTFDYRKFCKMFARQNRAEFLKANIKAVEDSVIVTDRGGFAADIIVDCTGWRTILASSLNKDYLNKEMLSFGIETELPYKDDKLRFFADPEIIRNGIAWLFPCGETARFGIGSYSGYTKLLPVLKRFVGRYGLKIGKIHGDHFCYCLKKPVIKNLFLVGCAAGQTLPLSGEGIKRSIRFGLDCGEIIQKIVDGVLSFEQGAKRYERLALSKEKYYNYLLKIQYRLSDLLGWKLNLAARFFNMKLVREWVWGKYSSI